MHSAYTYHTRKRWTILSYFSGILVGFSPSNTKTRELSRAAAASATTVGRTDGRAEERGGRPVVRSFDGGSLSWLDHRQRISPSGGPVDNFHPIWQLQICIWESGEYLQVIIIYVAEAAEEIFWQKKHHEKISGNGNDSRKREGDRGTGGEREREREREELTNFLPFPLAAKEKRDIRTATKQTERGERERENGGYWSSKRRLSPQQWCQSRTRSLDFHRNSAGGSGERARFVAYRQ